MRTVHTSFLLLKSQVLAQSKHIRHVHMIFLLHVSAVDRYHRGVTPKTYILIV
jgi:hypothetical protein